MNTLTQGVKAQIPWWGVRFSGISSFDWHFYY